MNPSVVDGIVIGAAGGALAGVTIWIVTYLHTTTAERRDRKRIHAWLDKNTSDVEGNKYRSTRTIASWNNLTEDRVRFICSIEPRIHLSTGTQEDLWSLYNQSA